MKRRLYLAYGSNLHKEQMAYRCPDATVSGVGFLEGYELLFKGSKTGSYLTVEPREGSQVPVAAWLVSEADERRLDRYEGFPAFYYKKELVLPIWNLKSGRVSRRRAFVYIMHEERKLGVPSLVYWRTCHEGYRDFDFDPAYLKRALDQTPLATEPELWARQALREKGGASA